MFQWIRKRRSSSRRRGEAPTAQELDRLVTNLLFELRATRLVDSIAVLDLLEAADRFCEMLGAQERVPREVTGKLWFAFTAMLKEADHARTPEAVLDAAWEYHDRLEDIFGPTSNEPRLDIPGVPQPSAITGPEKGGPRVPEEPAPGDHREGVVTELRMLEEELDRLTIPLLVELRMTKLVDATAMHDLLGVADRLRDILGAQELVPRVLVGKLWFVFTAMLSEAEHTRTPDAILDAAWEYAERLRAIFGPHFDMPRDNPV
ncbi:MAG: hypothetical protein M3394_00075 [Actinomycetota bacterium]|nr:hypothetical protein [Actinomycetota bacterium]